MPPPAGIAGVSSLIFATAASVVRKVLATLGREIWRGKLKMVDYLEMSTVGREIWQEN